MAKAKITGKIPGIDGEIEVTGNLATEDAIEDLIDAVEKMLQTQKIKTDDVQKGFDDVADSLEEFDDEITRVTRAQSKLTRQAIDLTKNTAAASAGFIKTTSNTNSMSDMIDSAGEVVAGFAGGVAGMIPVIGEGTARLAEATVMAGTALLSMAVGAVESFQAMNRSIMDGGLLLQGGFSGLADAADVAGLPVNQFGEAVMANINRLRLLEGGAPGGLTRLSLGFKALQEAQSENLDTLYALGFSQEEVVAGMSNVALGAQRAGRNLNNEELAAGTFDYLKNLRELSRLSGESAKSIQDQIDADRANLFVQNALLDVAPAQREAAAQFAAAIPDALGPIRDFIITGQSFTTESGVMADQMSTTAGIYRQAFDAVAQGVMTNEQATAFIQQSMRDNEAVIAAERENTIRSFGQAPGQAFSDILGPAILEGTRIGLSALQREADALAGTIDPETGEDTGRNLRITMGALAGATEAAQAALQSTFIEAIDRASGTEGGLTSFAQAISGAAGGAEAFRDAIFKAVEGDFEGAARALSGGIVERGGLDPNEYIDPLQRLPGADPNMLPGAADGDILTGPTSGYMAELHGTEAVVPLPDGRTIPVSLTTGGLNPNIIEALQTQSIAAAESVEQSVSSFSASLDNSRSLPELVNISRNMLSQMTLTAQRIESMVKAMDQANNITRTAAYVRA